MSYSQFVGHLREVRFSNTFNPYVDRCDVHDRSHAPAMRARLLESVLSKAIESEIDSLWLGRDLGYRGGRRTGLALTDDIHIPAHTSRWKLEAVRPTKGSPIAERTAAVVWRLLRQIETPVFLWNVFPFHPHEPEAPFSNRSHSRSERAVGEAILSDLVRLLKPKRIIALGNDAAMTATRILPMASLAVRHPSYGGQREFLRQISEIYGLATAEQPQLI